MKIGILDIQGSVEEHLEALKKLAREEWRQGERTDRGIQGNMVDRAEPENVRGLGGRGMRLQIEPVLVKSGGERGSQSAGEKIEPVLVKNLADLETISGLIIPGGESTTIGKLLRRFGLRKEIIKSVKNGRLAVWGTCAGAILLAKKIVGEQNADSLKLMDIVIERNAYGRQLDSFETQLEFDLGTAANRIGHSIIPGIFIRAPKILAVGKKGQILAKNGDEIVAVREKNMLATNFHPELTDNLEIHKYFVRMAGNSF